MTRSLGEIEAAARKAARGTGYSWGMAEEAAYATRWLCSAGIDGVAALVRLLDRVDEATQGMTYNQANNQEDGREKVALPGPPPGLYGEWRAASGILCPLMAGAALSDSLFAWRGAGEKRLSRVAAPVLLLPFAASAARFARATVRLEWGAVLVESDGAVARLSSSTTDPASGHAAIEIVSARTALAETVLVEIVSGGKDGSDEAATRPIPLPLPLPLPRQTRAAPTEADWDTLDHYARRTYAPASAESRLKGAGAGLLDED